MWGLAQARLEEANAAKRHLAQIQKDRQHLELEVTTGPHRAVYADEYGGDLSMVQLYDVHVLNRSSTHRADLSFALDGTASALGDMEEVHFHADPVWSRLDRRGAVDLGDDSFPAFLNLGPQAGADGALSFATTKVLGLGGRRLTALRLAVRDGVTGKTVRLACGGTVRIDSEIADVRYTVSEA